MRDSKRAQPAQASGYLKLRRLEQTIRSLAEARGLTGDPLAIAPPVADTFEEQLTAIDVYLDIPPHLRREAEAWPMAMAAAIGPGRATS